MRVVGCRQVRLALDVLGIGAGHAVERGLLLMAGRGQCGCREPAEHDDDNNGQERHGNRGFDQAEAALDDHFRAPTRPYIAEISETAMKPTMTPTTTLITGSISDAIARTRYSSSSPYNSAACSRQVSTFPSPRRREPSGSAWAETGAPASAAGQP